MAHYAKSLYFVKNVIYRVSQQVLDGKLLEIKSKPWKIRILEFLLKKFVKLKGDQQCLGAM